MNIAHICHNRHNRRWCTFFRAGVLCSIENVKLWPFSAHFDYFLHFITFLLAILSRIYTLFGVLCTGLNNVVVYQIDKYEVWWWITASIDGSEQEPYKKHLVVGNFIVSSDLVAWPAKKKYPSHPQTLLGEELVAFDIPQLSAIPIENTTALKHKILHIIETEFICDYGQTHKVRLNHWYLKKLSSDLNASFFYTGKIFGE